MNVWYASYGSNIHDKRFMCYINGTKAPGSSVKEIGCTDKTPPKESRIVELPYPLYFAKEHSKWGEGGVAFIGHKKTKLEKTVGRMYLITEQQFAEVVSQENKSPLMDINLQRVMEDGSGEVGGGWYGKILHVGEEDGYPIFTFTNPKAIGDTAFNKPSAAYLSTIATGLLELGYTEKETIQYFLHKQGIAGHFSEKSLGEYMFGGEKVLG